jgi:hypothetical protein
MDSAMSFCEHCQGNDRAQVLRALRQRKDVSGKRRAKSADEALLLALKMVAALGSRTSSWKTKAARWFIDRCSCANVQYRALRPSIAS